MGVFSKPKPKTAMPMAQPETGEEMLAVQKGLLEKYPDMVHGTGAWSKPAKKTKKPASKKASATTRTDATKSGLQEAGVDMGMMPSDMERGN